MTNPFADESGNTGHLNVVATIDFVPQSDRFDAELKTNPYCVAVPEREEGYKVRFFPSYLDAMNHLMMLFGNNIVTITWRTNELLIAVRMD
jgi:hypothetical protein